MRYIIKSSELGKYWNFRDAEWKYNPTEATQYSKFNPIRFLAMRELRKDFDYLVFSKIQGLKTHSRLQKFLMRFM